MTMTDPLLEVSQRLYEVLGRQGIAVDYDALGTHLSGKRILITGAAGSIGSALAELLARVSPASLTLLDIHENSLFHLRQHLGAAFPEAPLRYVLADVRNRRRIGQVLDDATPEVIFHLAAYKHVPLAEELPAEFAAVNVLGTWRLLQEARRLGACKLIYPSTDKAVNPPSIYGATKRSVELALQAAAQAYPELELTIARLVNVLGARGGVIETFVRQISAGLPVTITDPRMARYWITMDEALWLLTSAGAATGTGKILLLDLGEPVSVATLAERLWALFRPRGEAMHAEYSGSRPGERLFEELTYADEVTVRSDWSGVMQVQNTRRQPRALADVSAWLLALEDAVERCAEDELRKLLFDFVRGEAGE